MCGGESRNDVEADVYSSDDYYTSISVRVDIDLLFAFKYVYVSEREKLIKKWYVANLYECK